MTSRSSLPLAIVLGGDVNGLGVARSLARANVPLLLLDSDVRRPTMQTRHGRKMQVASLAGDDFVAGLIALGARCDPKPVLFPTQEATVATLSGAYGQICRHFALALPDDALVRTLLDKTGFQTRAEELGFPVPRSRYLSRDSSTVFHELHYPCVLKPATRDAEYGRRFAKAYRVERAQDAIALWQKMQTLIETAILQEWIAGADSDVYFCLQYRPPSGAAATSFCGRKTLQWPPLVGGTATCIPAPDVAAELTALTSDFFAKAGFVGLCSMEYKRNPANGTFTMIEPTVGRTDYQEEIASLNGINIPLAAYCDLGGISTGTVIGAMPPSGWRDPFGHHQARAMGAADPAAELMPQANIVDAYFRIDDPLPFLATKLAALRRRFRNP